MSPLLAQSGLALLHCTYLLSGVKRPINARHTPAHRYSSPSTINGPDHRCGTAALFRCFRIGMGKKEINMRLNAITATLAGALAVTAAASSAYGQYYYGSRYYPGYAYVYEPSYAYVAPAYPYAA